MATQKTNEIKAVDSGVVRNLLQDNVASANVLFFEATYEFLGTEATSGDTIQICELPVGAIVLPEQCRVVSEASLGGSALALPKIGDALDDDRYSATSISLDSSTAGNQTVTPNIAASVVTRWPITADTKRVIATFARTNAPTAGKKVKFIIAFRPR